MKRDDKVLLKDILECIGMIEKYTKNINEKKFFKNTKIQDAVMRRLEIIGEASKNVSTNFKNKYSEIEWKKISGMRDILIHAYFGVILERIWVVVKEDLPRLKARIKALLERVK